MKPACCGGKQEIHVIWLTKSPQYICCAGAKRGSKLEEQQGLDEGPVCITRGRGPIRGGGVGLSGSGQLSQGSCALERSAGLNWRNSKDWTRVPSA